MADKTQDQIRELRELVVAYAKQETIDPLKGLARYFGFGIGGALLMGLGFVFLEIGLLRLVQGWGPSRHFNGNMTWAPYGIVTVIGLALAGLVWLGRGKRKKKKQGS